MFFLFLVELGLGNIDGTSTGRRVPLAVASRRPGRTNQPTKKNVPKKQRRPACVPPVHGAATVAFRGISRTRSVPPRGVYLSRAGAMRVVAEGIAAAPLELRQHRRLSSYWVRVLGVLGCRS